MICHLSHQLCPRRIYSAGKFRWKIKILENRSPKFFHSILEHQVSFKPAFLSVPRDLRGPFSLSPPEQLICLCQQQQNDELLFHFNWTNVFFSSPRWAAADLKRKKISSQLLHQHFCPSLQRARAGSTKKLIKNIFPVNIFFPNLPQASNFLLLSRWK